MISFVAVGEKVKKILFHVTVEFLKLANERLLTGLDKIGTFVKRQHSATCLVKYYNAFFVVFIFCTEKQRYYRYFHAEFLPLYICIYILYSFTQLNMIQAPMVIVLCVDDLQKQGMDVFETYMDILRTSCI